LTLSFSPRRAARFASLALAFAFGCGDGAKRAGTEAPRPPSRPNILLITVDTLRADHLSAWGYARATSPRIDRLAAEGLRFSAAQAQWPKTGPSFTSMLSSTYPKDNGVVRQIGIPVPCSYTMLAEALKRSGYSTHAVVANGAVGREFYFDQGFDSFLETWKLPPPNSDLPPSDRKRRPNEARDAMLRAAENLADPNGAENVTRLALATAGRLDPAKPWFLWVHYLDPHFPYQPAAAFRDRFQGDEHFDGATLVPISSRHVQELAAIGKKQVLDGEERLGFYVARYDAEISYVDSEIGKLQDGLAGLKLLENTLTAFTSDHGESLGEHGYYFNHGRFAFQTCLHVPLILHWPGQIAASTDDHAVELIHLAPTLLEAAAVVLANGEWAQGRSLWPRITGSEPATAATISYSEGGTATNRAWIKVARDGRFSLHYAPLEVQQRWIAEAGNEFSLFDLSNDPLETKNVAKQFPEDTERLKRAVSKWWNSDRFPCETDGETCGDRREVDQQTTEQLKALGYL
jgi:arylsulfatase A-like enzyme